MILIMRAHLISRKPSLCLAVKEALSVSDEAMTYTLLMGALCYSFWLVIILALKPFKSAFNEFLRTEDEGLDAVLNSLNDLDLESDKTSNMW